MTTVVVTALGSALGVIGCVVALRPRSVPLRVALAALEGQPMSRGRHADTLQPPTGVGTGRYGAVRLAVAVSQNEYLHSRLRPLLAITGTTVQQFCGEVILGASVGVVLPGLWWLVLAAGGVGLPFAVPVWAGVMVGCAGGLIPVLLLHSKAIRARRSARRVLGSFLNLVVLCMAGGMGVEGALHASARIGEDDVSERILNVLVLAQDSGERPWDALDRLGRDLGVTELTELAAAVELAGSEGARIRLTLSAKASSIRHHDLAESESEANRMTERLFLPGVFLLVGFLVFIGYPAVARISAGL
jgi:tight adherence protein C